MTNCTEPNRKSCPRLCHDFCNKYEQDKLKQLNLLGYTEEELERDNPYNQWMYEDE